MSADSPINIPTDAEVSPELIEALVRQDLSPEDIEVVQSPEGKSVIRMKSGRSMASSYRTQDQGDVASEGKRRGVAE